MKLYLAGPDVFRPDVLKWAERSRALCQQYGHEALIPVDSVATTAAEIYAANRALIASADAIVANLNPFRGHEPDSGTCVEVGIALALGKPVWAYVADGRPMIERLGGGIDKQGNAVENFGMPLNLMIAVPACIVVGGLEDALRALS